MSALTRGARAAFRKLDTEYKEGPSGTQHLAHMHIYTYVYGYEQAQKRRRRRRRRRLTTKKSQRTPHRYSKRLEEPKLSDTMIPTTCMRSVSALLFAKLPWRLSTPWPIYHYSPTLSSTVLPRDDDSVPFSRHDFPCSFVCFLFLAASIATALKAI